MLVEFGHRLGVPEVDGHVIAANRVALDACNTLNLDQGVISRPQRPRIFIHVLGFALANFLDPLGHILVADLRLGIRHFNTAVVIYLEIGCDFEFSFEPERLAIVEMNVGDVRCSYDVPVLFVGFLAKCFRQNVFEHILADGILEPGLDNAYGSFPRPESRQVRFLLHVSNDVFRFVFHLVQRDGDFDFVLAAFNKGHV